MRSTGTKPSSPAHQNIGGAVALTYDEASHHSDAQCDGEREGLDASLFGRIDASCCNTREDVCHSERDPDSSQNTWTSPLNPEIRDRAAKGQRLLPTCFKDTKIWDLRI